MQIEAFPLVINAMEEHINELKKDGDALKQAVREKTLSYITAALGLVAGLAWNEAIKGLIDYFFPLSSGGLVIKFIYAVVITLVVILVGYYLTKLAKTED